MARIEKTVFISYRRKDISWALAVYQYLTAKKYDVFFDYTSIPSGDFEQSIISNIKARAHFILILTPSALKRCSNSDDWLRREIEIAIDEKRNIIPLFFDGFDFSLPEVSEQLTGRLTNLQKYNGLEIPSGYFGEAMNRLHRRYLKVTLNTVLHPVSTVMQNVIEEQKSAANKALIEGKGAGEEKVSFKRKLRYIFVKNKLKRYGITGFLLAILITSILGSISLIRKLSTPVAPTRPNEIIYTELSKLATISAVKNTNQSQAYQEYAIGPNISLYEDEDSTPEGIDFAKMASLSDFVIIRVGQNQWLDPDFRTNWEAAKKAGIPRGSYWFYDSRYDPKKQAELWRDALGDDQGELPLFADFEEDYGGPYAGWKNWYAFLEYLKDVMPEKEIVLYTGYHYWKENAPNRYTDASSLEYFHQYPLWIAGYGLATPSIPAPWGEDEWMFWQYTEHGDGLAFGVESWGVQLNYFNGNQRSFRARFGISE